MPIPPACRLLFALAACAVAACAAAAELSVRLDARDVVQRKAHVEMTIAATPGPLTLVYAKWIPGEHRPSGPLEQIVGLEIRAGGQRLDWQRDPLDSYALRIVVPGGADKVEVSMEAALPDASGEFTNDPSATERLAELSWNEFLLFPKGIDAESYAAEATLVAPPGWAVSCSLEHATGPDGAMRFEPTSLARLVDSPVQMGRYTQQIEVPGAAPRPDLRHRISVAADSAAALAVPDDLAVGYGRLVAEAGALFGSRMYRHYTWLVDLSDHVQHFGLEHHESSQNRREEGALLEPDRRMDLAGLLAHEYVHSWNGKYRRPVGLVSPDYQQPMDGSLLWVYEGLTSFLGDVLATRAGLMTAQDYLETLASYAASIDIGTGARWRSLADTAIAAPRLHHAPSAWGSSRRGSDYYDGAVFLWLDVDAELRTSSRGRLSIDDFARQFYAGQSGAPALKPYAEPEIYGTLAGLSAGDWRAFVHRHLDATDTRAMLGALEHSGWRLEYSPAKNTWLEFVQKRKQRVDRRFSVGLLLDDSGAVVDAIDDRAAARAGIGPGVKIVAVDGRRYSAGVLDAAIVAAQERRQPIALLVENADYFRTVQLDYYDGPRFPHLQRIADKPDLLTALITRRVR